MEEDSITLSREEYNKLKKQHDLYENYKKNMRERARRIYEEGRKALAVANARIEAEENKKPPTPSSIIYAEGRKALKNAKESKEKKFSEYSSNE